MLQFQVYTAHSLENLLSLDWKPPLKGKNMFLPSFVEKTESTCIEQKAFFLPQSQIKASLSFPINPGAVTYLLKAVGKPVYVNISNNDIAMGSFGQTEKGIFGSGFFGRAARKVFFESDLYQEDIVHLYDPTSIFSSSRVRKPPKAYIS